MTKFVSSSTSDRDQCSKDSIDDGKDVYFSGEQKVGHEESEETSSKRRDDGGHSCLWKESQLRLKTLKRAIFQLSILLRQRQAKPIVG